MLFSRPRPCALLPLAPDQPREYFVWESQVLLPDVQLEDVAEDERLLPEAGVGVGAGAEEEDEEVLPSQLFPQSGPVEIVTGGAGGDDDMAVVARSLGTEISNVTTITVTANLETQSRNYFSESCSIFLRSIVRLALSNKLKDALASLNTRRSSEGLEAVRRSLPSYLVIIDLRVTAEK